MQTASNYTLSNDGYMMPRIVDFGATRDKMAPQMHGNLPGFTECSTATILQNNRAPDSTTNNVPVTDSTSVNTCQEKSNEPQDKLPGFDKFLECLTPQPKDSYQVTE